MPKRQTSVRRKGAPSAKRSKAVSVDGSEVNRSPSRTNVERVRAMTKKVIQRDSDSASASDLRPVDFTTLEVDASKPQKRTAVLLKMEPEVLAFFKAGGRGYQTRINRVLRFYIEDVRRASAQRGAETK